MTTSLDAHFDPRSAAVTVNPLLAHPGGALALDHTVYGPRPRSAV
ncbi:hypothetical protein OG741_33125 [Streptomyces sp. NBC_01410]